MLSHGECAYGLIHLHKYIWTILCLCIWIILSALTYSCTFWRIWFKAYAQVHMKHYVYYVYADDLYHLHLHIITHFDCAYGLSYLHKYIWNIVCLCRWLVSSALTYTYTCWLCIWFKSNVQVHMKHCMSMQMT